MSRLTHCCCFSLRTGVLVLAVLGTLFALVNLVSYTAVLQAVEDADFEPSGSFDKDAPAILVKTSAVIAGINLARNVGLVVGVLYKKPWLMLPFIVIEVFLLVVYGVGFFAFVAVAVKAGFPPICGGIIAVWLLAWALAVYFLHVVTSHYAELRDQTRQRPELPMTGNPYKVLGNLV